MKTITIKITLLLISVYLEAQLPFSNSGNLQVHAGASLAGFGNFSNGSTGNFLNNGNVYLKGNLNNDQSSVNAGLGTLHLNGSGAQSVNGTQPFSTFNLVTDNAAGFTINNNLSISGSHTYTTGIITTSGTPNYLVYNAGSSYSGEGDNNHVNGWVKKIGSTDFSFPLGNGSVIRKVAVESLSGSLEFNARHMPSTPNVTSMQAPLVSIDPQEYWIVNRVNGSGSAQVHLNWDNSRISFPQYILSDIRAVYFTGGLWTEQGGSATGDVNTTGDITSMSVNSFGSFTFGSLSFMIPLRFLGITAQRKAGYNLVDWRTASAVNTDHFEIERSENGNHFKKIGSMISYNALSAISYSFKDTKLIPGTLWYRIRSVDRDGSFKLSDIVSVTDAPANQAMYVLNNPAHGSIHLFAPQSYKGSSDYSITNSGGQIIQKGTIKLNGAGNVFIQLNPGISHGVYILHVKNGKEHFMERLVLN